MNLELLAGFLERLGRGSAQAAVLVLLVLATQRVFRRWLTPRWRCALWLLVVGRLVLPVSLPTPVSVFNLMPAAATAPGADPVSMQPLMAIDPGDRAPASAGWEVPPTVSGRGANSREAVGPLAPTPGPRGSAAATEPAASNFRPAAGAGAGRVSWPALLFGLWLTGTLLLAGHVVVASMRVALRVRGLPRVTDPDVLAVLDDCRARLRVRTRLEVVEGVAGAEVRSPALHGIFRPRLLLPAGFLRAFSREELRFVFLHELAHVKRWDVALNWMVALLQVAHWFNPLLWLGFARWRVDRELACDALALEMAGAGRNKEYGRTILRLLDGFTQRAPVPGLVGILEDKRQLHQRIRMIAAFVPGKRWSVPAAALLAALAMVGLTDGQTPDAKSHSATPKATSAAAPPSSDDGRGKPAVGSGARNEAGKGRVLTRLTVVADESGAPLAGVRVLVGYFFSGSRMEGGEAETDAEGVAVIRGYDSSYTGGINVFVTPDGHVPKVIGGWPVAENIPPAYTMRMARATRVAGVVKDEVGRPVAGVKVNLARPGIRDQTALENIDFHPRLTAVVTDEEGRWSFHYVPKDFETVGILMDHPDYAVSRGTVPVLKPESTNAVVVIERGVTLQGRISGPDGAPVAGAEIKEVHNYGYNVRSTRSGGDGSYSLIGIRRGEIKLVVQADRLAPGFRSLNETGALAKADFSLNRGQTFRGRILDKAGGQPIAGAVAQTDWDNRGLRKVAWETKTDAEGRFEWNAAPDEALFYWFQAEGFGWKRGVLLRPGDAEHQIVLERTDVASPPVRVSGRVIDATTRQPIPKFRVSIGEVRQPEFPPEYSAGSGGTAGEYRLTINTPCPFPSYFILVQAEGYRPAKSVAKAINDGNAVLDFELTAGSGPAGVVQLPDGRPAAHAMVYLTTLREGVYISQPGVARADVSSAVRVRADEQGRFALPLPPDAYSVIVLHDEGFVERSLDALEGATNIVIEPWGRIEGQLLIGSKPAANETISLQTMQYRYGDGVRSFSPLSLHLTAETDGDGRFAIEKVPPGERKIAHWLSLQKGAERTIAETQGLPIEVKAGETTSVTVGGVGRPVIGRVVLPNQPDSFDFSLTRDTNLWRRGVHSLTRRLPDPSEMGRPKRGDFRDDSAFIEALKRFVARHKAFWTSREGRALERLQRSYAPVFNADGSFRIDDVPAGPYELTVKLTRHDLRSLRPGYSPGDGKTLGVLTNTFIVPLMRGGRNDDPLDLGTLTLSVIKTLKVGQKAPGFEAENLADPKRHVMLADYRGKYVLLDFWATWCGPCLAELPDLKSVWGAFGEDQRFAMISLSLDYAIDAPREFAQTNGLSWVQGFLGDWSKTTVPSDYEADGIPAVFLIAPDGTIVARDLRGSEIKEAVAKALEKAR